MKTNALIAQALTNLRVSDDFSTVLEFLADERSLARDECETHLEGPKLWRAQGRSSLVRDFLALNAEAPRDLEKFKSKK